MDLGTTPPYASRLNGRRINMSDLSGRDWAFIYRSWARWSYGIQIFGVLWIVWGLGLTFWVFARPDARATAPGPLMILAAVLIVPFAIMFFGGLRFRRWVRKRDSTLQGPPQDYPLNMIAPTGQDGAKP